MAVRAQATPASAAPSGAAGGDLSGTYPNPTVAKINSKAVTLLGAGTLLSTGDAAQLFGAGNPTGTTSTAGVMMGIGATCSITPVNSTRLYVVFTCIAENSTILDGVQITGRYGTGAAPANAAAAAGAACTSVLAADTAVANLRLPMTLPGLITGLTPGTTYWLDLQLAAITGGTASLFNVGCIAFEI